MTSVCAAHSYAAMCQVSRYGEVIKHPLKFMLCDDIIKHEADIYINR